MTVLFQLLCGVSLFLFGMNRMGSGLKKVAGKKLEVILYRLAGNPLKGILLGTGVTAVIQSSSATSVMTVGFVNSGMMQVNQAIGIIMGAILGTSVTGWVICLSGVNGSGIFALLSTDTLTALMAVVGIVLLMFTKKKQNHNIADILLGFAVLMVGISTMSGAVAPLRENETFLRLMTDFSSPILGILIGFAFTCVIQSASAAVGILQTLAVTGAVSFRMALPMLMGIAIGASVPVLLSALGANVNGKRTALIYLLVDTLGALLFGGVFYTVNAFVGFSFMDAPMTMLRVALLNTVFRAAVVVLLTPFIGVLEKLVCSIVREKKNTVAELEDAERLEERFLAHPPLALEQTRIAVNSMAKLSLGSVVEALQLFTAYSQDGADEVYRLENIVDTYEDKLGGYIVRLMKNEMDEQQNREITLFLHSITDFERIADHAKNLAEAAQELKEKEIVFSEEANAELSKLYAVMFEIMENTENAFVGDNLELAYRIAPLEEIIDNLCQEYKGNHIRRVQEETCRYHDGFVFNDMLTDMERVGDHCSNLGIALRIQHGEVSGRHGAMTKAEVEQAHHFDELYREYAEKFGV